ncbi:hypothetical protein KC878_02725 [Candidatus Saccharibacteria bacterium]|nr:hypothetical protein [Candidatus Saccharibacteria bacterium]MCB9821278.1 hypothetical protein [Candidatus Nomurabacteria bacterium]
MKTESISSTLPDIILEGGVTNENAPCALDIAQRLQGLGVASDAIAGTTVIVDDRNRLTTRGSAWPAGLAKIRFRKYKPEGPVISLGTKLRGKPITPDQRDTTVQHELIHVAQDLDPNNHKIEQGWALRVGAIAAGAVLGYKVAGAKGAFAGVVLGDRLGYTYGPHEVEARKLSNKGGTSIR